MTYYSKTIFWDSISSSMIPSANPTDNLSLGVALLDERSASPVNIAQPQHTFRLVSLADARKSDEIRLRGIVEPSDLTNQTKDRKNDMIRKIAGFAARKHKVAPVPAKSHGFDFDFNFIDLEDAKNNKSIKYRSLKN
jgi:hypothetical protein